MPHMTSDDFRSVLDAFISGWISSKGPYVNKFEEDFSRFVGVRHGVAVSNGTVALHLALVALGIGPGDEVIVPDLTFAATINAVLYCGATPVIVDVDRQTWCMSREAVKRACTAQTKAIIPVHLYGRPAEIGPIADFARGRGIAVVEDCAEAHGARYRGKAVGQFGDVSCFSFYANKIVTTGEGGMCVTDSPELATSLRVLRDHGMSPDRSYWHERVGFNYRITNLQAAIGQSQIWRVNEVLQRNARIAALYREALKGIPDVRFPPQLPDEYRPVVWMTCVQVPAEKRLPLMRAAHEAQIETRPFFHPLSALPPYGKYARSCPNSIELSATGVNLPTSHSVDETRGRTRRPRVPRRVRVTEEASAMLSSVIIGGGPGGLGPILWAAQHGLLPAVARSRRGRGRAPGASRRHAGPLRHQFGLAGRLLPRMPGGGGPAGGAEAVARRTGGA